MSINHSSTPVRVRYYETDQMGVVHHSNYIRWFEIGRTELIRQQLGHSYSSVEHKGVQLPVLGVSIRYLKPAVYDDVVDVHATIAEYTGVKLTFRYEVYRGEELLVTGESMHCWTDQQMKPIHLRKKWPELDQLIQGMI